MYAKKFPPNMKLKDHRILWQYKMCSPKLDIGTVQKHLIDIAREFSMNQHPNQPEEHKGPRLYLSFVSIYNKQGSTGRGKHSLP